MTQPWNPEVQGKAGISPEEYNNWVNNLNSQTSMGVPRRTNPEDYIMDGPAPGRRTTIAHPDHPLMGGPGFGTGGVPGSLPPLPDDNAQSWLEDLLFRSTGSAGGNTLAQDIAGGNIGAGSSNAALGFLQGVGNKLKDLWNKPIMAPTITKDEHDRLIRGEGGGEKNWQNTPQY